MGTERPPELRRTGSGLLAWLEAAPAGTLVDAQALARELATALTDGDAAASAQAPSSWRERLWTAPPETRIGVAELCEAVGRGKGWVYRHTGDGRKARKPDAKRCDCPRLPHRLIDGELVFLVGEVRGWLAEHEVVVVPGRTVGLVVTGRRSA